MGVPVTSHSFPSCPTMFFLLVVIIGLHQKRKKNKNGHVPEWNRLDKYNPSTFHVQRADVWQFVQET